MKFRRNIDWCNGTEKVTPEDLRKAKLLWLKNRERSADFEIVPFLELESQKNGLKTARTALMISTGKMAEKLKVKRSTYVRMEKSVETGSISIRNLKKAAHLLDCELVYALIPTNRKIFSENLFDKLIAEAIEKLKSKKHMPSMRGYVLDYLINSLLGSHKYRKSQGWTERRQMSQDPQGET